MSMIWPPHSVKIVSTPSFFRALAARWPPEMTLASVLRCFSVSVAVVDMIPLAPSRVRLARLLARRLRLDPGALHVRVQIERMLAHQTLGQIGIARFERFDDVGVIDDRAPHPIALGHGARTDRAHVDEQAVCDVLEQRALGQLENALMELDVDLGILVDLGAHLFLAELRQHLAQRADLGIARAARGQARRHAFERRPGDDHLEDLAHRLAHDHDALARQNAHQALLLEARERFADRRTADAQLLRELTLVQLELGVLGVDVHRGDAVLQHLVDVILEAEIAVDRLEDEPSRHDAFVRSLAGRLRPAAVWLACMWYTTSQLRRQRLIKALGYCRCGADAELTECPADAGLTADGVGASNRDRTGDLQGHNLAL